MQHGWSEKPTEAYTEDEIEEGYVCKSLFIASCHGGMWCHTSIANYYEKDGMWWVSLGANGNVRDLTIYISTTEQYERLMDFYNGFPKEN